MKGERGDSRFWWGNGSNVVEKVDLSAETAVLPVDNIGDNVDNTEKYPNLLRKYAEMFGYSG